jgi:hypothetical protein
MQVKGQTVFNRDTILLGSTSFFLDYYHNPQGLYAGKYVFVHVHDNEETAFELGKKFVDSLGGDLYTIVHSPVGKKKRYLSFDLEETIWSFDPNRIYSDNPDPLERTLRSKSKNPKNKNEAIKVTDLFAKSLWSKLAEYPIVISLHNNRNSAPKIVRNGWFKRKIEMGGFSVVSYIQQDDKVTNDTRSASDVYVNPEMNESEFFIVTEKKDFDFLSKNKQNVVLQSDEPYNDGSMSVFAAKQNKRYINVEALYGRSDGQQKMIEMIYILLVEVPR